jgi:excisionase family DNA binding protein
MTTDDRLKALIGADATTLAAVDAALAGTQQAPASLRLYRLCDAAKELGISRTTLWRAIRDGRLRVVEIRDGAKRIPEAELMKFAGVAA